MAFRMQLHLEIIHQEESISERERQCELQLEQLKDDVSRLQFVSTQKAQALSQKESEVAKLHAQLERLLAVGGATRSQHPAMEMRGRLAQSHSAVTRGHGVTSPSGMDRSAVEDVALINELQSQLRELNQELAAVKQTREDLSDKLQHREQEIARLSKLTEDRASGAASGGASAVRVYDVDVETSELQIEQLRAQVDLLNSQVAKYESRLRSANDQLRRHTTLEQKLRDAETLNDQVQRELQALQSKYLVVEEELMRAGRASRSSPPVDAPVDTRFTAHAENEGDVAPLKAQIETLTAQNERLEDALRATHYDKVSFTNALSNANSHNRVLATDLERSETKTNEISANYNKTQLLLADATARLEMQARELDVLRDSLQQADQTRAMESEKNAALHGELRAMDKVLQQRNDDCRTLQHELSIQKRELDQVTARLNALKRSVENEDENAAGDDTSTTKRTALHAQEMKWLEDERRELRQSREELMTKVLQLEQDVQATKMELHTTQLERDDLATKLIATTKLEQNVQQLLDVKKQEAIATQREVQQWKECAQRTEDELAQAKTLLQRADQIETERIRFQNELLEVRRRVEELRDENASLKTSVEHSDRQTTRFQTQLQQLQQDVSISDKSKNAMEKELLELTRSYDSATIELRNVRQLSQHYQSEYEKLVGELQANQQSLTSEQSALQNSQVHLSDLRTQIRQLQSEVSLKQNALHHAETRLEQEKASHKTVQSQLLLAQDEVLQLKEVNRSMEINLRQLRDDLKAKDMSLTEKTEAVENLKLLLEQMETSRDQILFKLKQEQQHSQRQQLDTEDLHSRLRDAEEQGHVWQAEITSLKKLTRTLDAEKDHVHDQLDLLTEKIHELSEQNERLRRESQEGDSSVRTHQERMAQLVEQLRDAESKAKELEQRIHQLENELESVRHAKAMGDAEQRALAQDLENMTIENQALSEECTRLQFASQRGDQSSATLKNKLREVEKDRDILHVELEDLQQTYRSLIQESEGTQKALAQAGAASDELTTVNESLRSQLSSLTNEMEVLRQKNATLSTECGAYRDQLSFLTEKLRTNEDVLRETDHKYETLRNELDAQRQVAQEISAQRYGAQAQTAAVAQRIVHLEAKASNAQFEVKSLQEKLKSEEIQRRRLEEVVVGLRQQIAANDAAMEQVVDQRDALADEVRTTHQRLVATNAMDMSELSHSPPSRPANASPASASQSQREDRGVSPSDSDKQRGGSSSSSSILPMRALEMAQRKCQELEDRLALQDETIQVLSNES
jgi:chromosome segregation ATPase